ncbi:hypothetical protein F5984_20040 [Rudanella paleaurantiibacter]|uniref:Uncharacterized protein n=1 Tax=Rudanella paleaurantiibacter TaxID=2614655 RepID=A0A7J5TVE2_9BACT|nr:hypothetical protein [Rudanella paleaurantiibacter]KAB7728047.1 hypothetical protein F5984_20040 [Rudanella paleaurantiibacter]
MKTIQEHYKRLRHTDLDRWNEMNATLARQSINADSNCLMYFERTVLRKERAGGVDLRTLPFAIADALVTFLGFSLADIRSNTIPDA